MSIFGKLLGRRSAAEEREHADALFARGEFGLAKLAYDRAHDLARAAPEAERTALAQRADACRDALARARIAEADKLLAAGALDLALAELQNAAETAASSALLAEAERRIEALDRAEAREKAQLPEQSEDDRFETIAGSFEDEQYAEYDARGPELRAALLALSEGSAAQARPLLERLVQAGGPLCYLWFELGRARLLDGDVNGGREALQRFLAELTAGGGGEARLVAHMELAALHDEAGDFDAAAGEYEAAVEAIPDDPRPYLAMAQFFRRAKLPGEAIEVLRSGLDALEEAQRQWRFKLELGLAHAELGEEEHAIELLEEVVEFFTSRRILDMPPDCAVPLAALHEQRGNATRALDLYNLLASGSDARNHFTYYREAARLMLATGHRSDARRALVRALELAPDEPAVRDEIARKLAELK